MNNVFIIDTKNFLKFVVQCNVTRKLTLDFQVKFKFLVIFPRKKTTVKGFLITNLFRSSMPLIL